MPGESPDQVYQQIMDDLTFAKENLPESYSGGDVGSLTSYNAAAILAKVYLTRKNKQAAQTELEYIINSGMFSLDANSDGIVNTRIIFIFFSLVPRIVDLPSWKPGICPVQMPQTPTSRRHFHHIWMLLGTLRWMDLSTADLV